MARNGRTGDALWAGNCATCHGATAHGGRNALGVRGPDVACTASNDFLSAVRDGEDRMPRYPALTDADIAGIVTWVHGQFCSGG